MSIQEVPHACKRLPAFASRIALDQEAIHDNFNHPSNRRLILGSATGASGKQALGIGGVGMAAGLIRGMLLTKGSEIRVAQGSILRIKFLKPATLAVIQQAGAVRQTSVCR